MGFHLDAGFERVVALLQVGLLGRGQAGLAVLVLQVEQALELVAQVARLQVGQGPPVDPVGELAGDLVLPLGQGLLAGGGLCGGGGLGEGG